MQVEIRSDGSMKVSGYVNTTGRESRVMSDVTGKFVEVIEPGVFKRALEKNKNLKMLLNHDEGHELANQKDGTLTLYEDSIGLRAEAVITDSETVKKARAKKLRGWSFGMYVLKEDKKPGADKIVKRSISEIELEEISLIDDRMNPCYTATSIETRGTEEYIKEKRAREDELMKVDCNESTLEKFKERLKKREKKS